MIDQTTQNINIAVEPLYLPEESNPANATFVFSYDIRITNHNFEPIKLLTRYWKIYDSNNTIREVSGDGVVGIQPIIDVDKTYRYQSFCHLHTEIGYMEGYYEILKLTTGELLEIPIPRFHLYSTIKLN